MKYLLLLILTSCSHSNILGTNPITRLKKVQDGEIINVRDPDIKSVWVVQNDTLGYKMWYRDGNTIQVREYEDIAFGYFQNDNP